MAASLSTFAVSLCSIVVLFSLVSTAAPNGGGFSIELIHRESPKSPYYNPDLTPYQRLRNSISRSARLTTITIGDEEPVSEIISDRGSYLMNILIGTPPVQIIAIADTGSDLIWTQCKPCNDCFHQKNPLFDPRNSKTYRNLSCSSEQCGMLDQQASCSPNGSCRYQYSYGDRSYTKGDVALETVSLASTSGRPVAFRKTIFGCGHANQGTFDDNTSGIIGLGAGPVSLVSQMGKASGGDRFSYCLVPFFAEGDKSSKLSFGSKAIVSGKGVVSTPLISNPQTPTFYYLTLLGLTVGGDKTINYVSSSSSEGNIIIDSGTTLTFLPEEMYSQVESEVAAKIPLDPVRTELLSLCYKTKSDIDVPDITVHFDGDADLKLSSNSTFVRLDEETLCFAFKSTSGGLAIYGNLAQINYLVGYDKVKNVVAFKPADCSKF